MLHLHDEAPASADTRSTSVQAMNVAPSLVTIAIAIGCTHVITALSATATLASTSISTRTANRIHGQALSDDQQQAFLRQNAT